MTCLTQVNFLSEKLDLKKNKKYEPSEKRVCQCFSSQILYLKQVPNKGKKENGFFILNSDSENEYSFSKMKTKYNIFFRTKQGPSLCKNMHMDMAEWKNTRPYNFFFQLSSILLFSCSTRLLLILIRVMIII